MHSFKPKFLRPESETSGLTEERKDTSDEHTCVVYNPNSSLSIDQQRQRLPIFKLRNHILYLLEKYQTLVIVGETSCGKSTQIPQYLVEAGWSTDGMIGVTQPRRVAAVMLANRVAYEIGAVLGQDVGYSIRFDECIDINGTKIKYMTEGILIQEMMGDPLLSAYSVLILDEAHERSLYTDILLGLLKKILRRQPNLKLIVSSATLDAESLWNFFNNNETSDRSKDKAAILSIEGRNFPVEVHYVLEPVADYVKASVDTVIKIHQCEPRGDVLVFLTGQEEVEFAVSLLIDYAKELKNKKDENKLFILPLYGALPSSEQLKVFQSTPHNVRKVIVATNIAEASLTVNGIVYVVDCGFVKLRYFSPQTGMDSLVVVPVSQASAEQRAGRAGRVTTGKVYRLYTENDFHNLPLATPPEIQRSSLSSVILQLKAMGIENILRFNFPATPPSGNVISALELLYALKVLDDDGKLTKPLGTMMVEFPLHPMFSKMLLVSGEFGCSEEALKITAMLQVQNVFFMQPNKNIVMRKARHKFSVEEGDHITLLNVYNSFIKQNENKKWCEANYLNYKGLIRAKEIRAQLAKLLSKFKIPLVSCEGDVDVICKCIVSGFFANAAYLHPTGNYRTIRGDHPLHLHPSSVVYTQKQPQWVVFNEVLHTSKEYMRDVTVIQPSWLYELAPHYYQYGTAREIAEQEKGS